MCVLVCGSTLAKFSAQKFVLRFKKFSEIRVHNYCSYIVDSTYISDLQYGTCERVRNVITESIIRNVRLHILNCTQNTY